MAFIRYFQQASTGQMPHIRTDSVGRCLTQFLPQLGYLHGIADIMSSSYLPQSRQLVFLSHCPRSKKPNAEHFSLVLDEQGQVESAFAFVLLGDKQYRPSGHPNGRDWYCLYETDQGRKKLQTGSQ